MTVTASGVKVIGYTDLPGRLPTQSSEMYATNLVNLTKLLSKEKDGNINIDFEDVILRSMSVIEDGKITFPPPAVNVSAAPTKNETVKPTAVPKDEKRSNSLTMTLSLGGIILLALIGMFSPQEFLYHFTVFILACVVGYYVVWNVTYALHTPLMSVTNAISGIILVGALLQIGPELNIVTILSFIAILITTINVVGGFMVTQRMLKMFSKE